MEIVTDVCPEDEIGERAKIIAAKNIAAEAKRFFIVKTPEWTGGERNAGVRIAPGLACILAEVRGERYLAVPQKAA